jgi:hypothetical protein
MSKNTPTEDCYGRVGINPIERRKKRKGEGWLEGGTVL